MNDLTKIDAAASAAAGEEGLGGELGNVAQTCPAMTLEVGVFFDGTLNNRFNTRSRARNDDSYRNALSNPALLFDRYKFRNGTRNGHDIPNACGGVARRFRRIYAEGAGSVRGEEDDQTGYAFGMGRRSGVEARVLDTFRRLNAEILLQGGPPNLEKVILDVFGFSRGAASARYFVNAIRARRIRYDPWGPGDWTETLPAGLDVEIRFLGIFDTVAAIGDAADDDNDPINVHLKTEQATGRIYHLTAEDEYRRNFRLNHNLERAKMRRTVGLISGTGGDSLGLPGAHSDIGGGYEVALRLPGDPPPGEGGSARTGDTAPLGRMERRVFYSREEALAAQARTRAEDLRPGANAEIEADFVREGFLRPNETQGGVVRHMGEIQVRTVRVSARGQTFVRTLYEYDEQLALHRPWVKLGLSRVALNMMYEAAVEQVDGAFLDLPNTEDYRIPSDMPHVAAMRAGTVTPAQRADILRNFGHVSMKDGPITSSEWLGHRPDEDRERMIYPNLSNRAI
ncbi:phospholipase effector Tle1 domain-containing protein [Jannaschia aquimarina]|uniref:T6SS Phospholipase effector Tle1-like catalytic domain-containing protein n=1 Tax=Jannaschia aquimarina TaxID=935700 RepID=A0A0D1CQ52_9RHOB|nr:DUF2235 domain-containing protein [Jannaschia aquimarina]KIT16872.1 hypothetical protein jaqu_13700 [Jannaschia aquimarina]SNT12611.1 Uncharacterized alpha/beta hydrolase domain [Jannaschia aquimarina]